MNTVLSEPSANQELYSRARNLIPGGTQLLSKRPEMFAPEQWPPYYRKARGCTVVDMDGREFLDFSTNGIGSCLLGFADPDVSEAVIERVRQGAMCSLNSPDEVTLAARLIELHPWADQARFGRTGGESLAIAVRIARARTGRDVVAFCGYHGWSDWYLAANLASVGDSLSGHLLAGLQPKGIPASLAGTALPFTYNRADEFRAIVERQGSNLAAVVMEPCRGVEPQPGFLEEIREICDAHQVCLIFDEVTTGFRLRYGGIHLEYGVNPDIAVFAKALGNGHPVSAIIGRREWMSAAAETFISSTYWTESVGFSAALATLEKLKTANVAEHIENVGLRVRAGLKGLAEKYDIPLKLSGRPAQTYIAFSHPEGDAFLTLYTVKMLDRGILAGGAFYPTLAHREEHVQRFLREADAVFAELREAQLTGTIAERIGGPVKHSGFQRLN